MKLTILFTCLLLFPQFIFSQKKTNNAEHEALTFITYLPFIYALEKTNENYKITPCIECKECKSKLLNHDIFISSVSEKILKETLNQKYTTSEMKVILDKIIELLSNGTAHDMENFMVKMSNEIGIFCLLCGKSNWQLIGENN